MASSPLVRITRLQDESRHKQEPWATVTSPKARYRSERRYDRLLLMLYKSMKWTAALAVLLCVCLSSGSGVGLLSKPPQ